MANTGSKRFTCSVVMTTFNGAKYLREQLDSILRQTLKPLEIIVCDDNSSDETIEILKEYHQKYNIIYLINPIRLGVIENFKKAVSLSKKGDFVALADQDDIWLPEKLEVLSDKLATLDLDNPSLVYSDLSVINSKGLIVSRSFWNELGQDGYQHCFQTLLFGNFITGCSVLMNRSMAELFKTMPSNVLMHDAWIGLAAYSFGSVDRIDKPLVLYRKHEHNVMHSADFTKDSTFKRRLKNFFNIFLGDETYLVNQINLVAQFYNVYKTRLSESQRQQVEKFLKLDGRNFLRKRIALSNAFKGLWLTCIPNPVSGSLKDISRK